MTKKRITIVIETEGPEDASPPLTQRVKRMLKGFLRYHGLRCCNMREGDIIEELVELQDDILAESALP